MTPHDHLHLSVLRPDPSSSGTRIVDFADTMATGLAVGRRTGGEQQRECATRRTGCQDDQESEYGICVRTCTGIAGLSGPTMTSFSCTYMYAVP